MAGRPGPQSVWWALFSLKGRIRRATFALGGALVFSIWWVCLSQAFAGAEGSEQQENWTIVLGLVAIATSYCLYALMHKRLQDLGYMGFFAIAVVIAAFFAPIVVMPTLFVLSLFPGNKEDNPFGPPPVRD